MLNSIGGQGIQNTAVRIFLINSSGTLLWSNLDYMLTQAQDDILLSAIFTALTQFTKETINESLQSLKINNYHFMFFDVSGFYQIVLFYPSFLQITETRLVELKNQIFTLYQEIIAYDEDVTEFPDPEEYLPLIIAVLSDFDLEMKYKLAQYERIKETLKISLKGFETLFNINSCSIILLGWDGERVYSYRYQDHPLPLLNNFLINSKSTYDLKSVLNETRIHNQYGSCEFNVIHDFLLITCSSIKPHDHSMKESDSPVVQELNAFINSLYLTTHSIT